MSYSTYQDLLAVGDDPKKRAEFVKELINEHTSSELYKTAVIADEYNRGQNTTIKKYQKTLTTITGKIIPDNLSPTHRIGSSYYHIFTSDLVKYLLGQGVTWTNEKSAKKLGIDFDSRLAELAKAAIDDSVAFGFFNYDHVEVFQIYSKDKPCFRPVYDEETGALMAGVRYWQLSPEKPLRAALYEPDGITEYMYVNSDYKPENKWQRIGDGMYTQNKYTYKQITLQSKQEGTRIIDAANYSALPIFPMYANDIHQPEILRLRDTIDAYDFILNGFADDIDNAKIFWIIKGAAGMDDPDLVRLIDRLRAIGAVAPSEGQEVTPYTIEIPVEARERLLDRLKEQLYIDARAFNPDDVKSGSTVNAQIDAAYEPLNKRADELETGVLDFLYGIMKIAGIEDKPSFTRDKLSNTNEIIQVLLQSGSYLSQEYITKKILTLLGDVDKIDEVLAQIDGEDMTRLGLDNANNADE